MYYFISKAKKIINESDIDVYQSIYLLYQVYKCLLEKFWAVLLVQCSITLLIFPGTTLCLVAVTSNWQNN